MTPLTDLLRRVEGATGKGRKDGDLEADLSIYFDNPSFVKVKTKGGYITTASPKYAKAAKEWIIAGETEIPARVLGSVDAALEFVECRLGYQHIRMRRFSDGWYVEMGDTADADLVEHSRAPNAAIGLVGCVLRICIARSGSSQSSNA